MRWLPLLLPLSACGADKEARSDTGPEEDPPSWQLEQFTYVRPRLDLVFLIDAPIYVGDLLETLDVFVASLKSRDIDFHLGLANIDFDPVWSGALERREGRRWVDDTHPEAVTWLRGAMLDLPDRSPDEVATFTAYQTLKKSRPGRVNQGFLRDSSHLAFLLFSDNYDTSDAKGVTQWDLVDLLRELRPEPDRLGFHMIRWIVGDPWGVAHDLEVLREEIPGLWWDATTLPYFPLLLSIAHTVERTNVFELHGHPDPSTLSATVRSPDGEAIEIPGSRMLFDASANRVDLDSYFPPPDSSVVIHYLPADD